MDDSDEVLARRLQAQFDAEELAAQKQQENDAAMAQKLATQSHNLSDSEQEEDSVQEVYNTNSHTISDDEDDLDSSPVRPTSSASKSSPSSEVKNKKRADGTSGAKSITPSKSTEKKLSTATASTSSPSSEVKRKKVVEETSGAKFLTPSKSTEAKLSTATASASSSPSSEVKHKKVVEKTSGAKFLTPSKSAEERSSSTPTERKDSDGKKKKNEHPVCQFGEACYRKNPWHLQEFYHPHLEDNASQSSPSSSGTMKRSSSEPSRLESSQKKLKVAKSSATSSNGISASQPFQSRLSASTPFNLFLNKTYSVKETEQDPLALVLPDLLSPHMGELVESAQLSFMVDLEFFMTYYKKCGQEGKPLLIMYGQLGGKPGDYPKLTCTKVNIPFQYGTHHTKMMLLQYKKGLRVVVHTANLVPDDWYEKTQGFWISPLFPELEGGKSSVLDGESPTRFKRDLLEYLQSYKAPDLTRWSHIIKSYDFSTCNAVLVCSSPGYHIGDVRERWGHMKVRRILHQHAATWPSSQPVIVQCSSIGNLGKDERTWLSGELGVSLTGAPGQFVSQPRVQVIYPSEDDVYNSSQGWMGGSCLPYNSNTHEKQTWLAKHLHLWRSEIRKRSSAMPHIKTYTRANKTNTATQYFLLTSANLSKAAWGTLQKNNSQLFIRSYEAGVILLPKFVMNNENDFKIGVPGLSNTLALPYDLPPTPYPVSAIPWFMNTKKKKKDSFGQSFLD